MPDNQTFIKRSQTNLVYNEICNRVDFTVIYRVWDAVKFGGLVNTGPIELIPQLIHQQLRERK